MSESLIDKLQAAEEEYQTVFATDLAEGSTITLGKFHGMDVEWRVLRVWKKEKKALLISEKALLQMKYHKKLERITWENCTLRKWLNQDFIEKEWVLDAKIKSRVMGVLNHNDDSERYKTPGGNDTWDRVFLLSIKEVERYMKSIKERVCQSEDSVEAVWWWLRSPGYNDYGAAGVDHDGTLLGTGHAVHDGTGSVRPAFYLNLES